MVTIKCSVYEKYDLLKLLDYAKEKNIKIAMIIRFHQNY